MVSSVDVLTTVITFCKKKYITTPIASGIIDNGVSITPRSTGTTYGTPNEDNTGIDNITYPSFGIKRTYIKYNIAKISAVINAK